MPVEAYLSRTMLARLLACLALVTGLAAIGTPVQARLLEAASEQVESSAQGSQAGKNAVCVAGEQRSTATAADSAQVRCRTRKPVIVYIPTVHFGADRAYE